MGRTFIALFAGNRPINTLMPTISKKEMVNWGILTIGFTKGKSSPLPQRELATPNNPIEIAKPIKPAK